MDIYLFCFVSSFTGSRKRRTWSKTQIRRFNLVLYLMISLHFTSWTLVSSNGKAESWTKALRILPVLQFCVLSINGEKLWGFLWCRLLSREAIRYLFKLSNRYQRDRNDSSIIPFRTFDSRCKFVISEGKSFKPENAR